MNKELETLRDSIAQEYARLYELEDHFTQLYESRLSEERDEDFSGSHRCFSEVAAVIWQDVLRLEKCLVDLPELLDSYIWELKEEEQSLLDEIRQASDHEHFDVDPYRLDELDRCMEAFQKQKAYWEHVRYRIKRRQDRHLLGDLTSRQPVRSESGVLLSVELLYSSGTRRVIKLADGIPASLIEDTDSIPF